MSLSPFNPLFYPSTKRKVFISYYKGDKVWVDQFVGQWGSGSGNVFIPKVLGIGDYDDFVNSTNPEYVMSQIRDKYLEDSSITIILIGACTHSRRFVDWEIKSSLRCSPGSLPNGLLGILIPPLSQKGPPWPYLPERLNCNLKEGKGYAKYYMYPNSSEQLKSFIEEAYEARTSKLTLIENPQDMMKYNASCFIHGEVHSV